MNISFLINNPLTKQMYESFLLSQQIKCSFLNKSDPLLLTDTSKIDLLIIDLTDKSFIDYSFVSSLLTYKKRPLIMIIDRNTFCSNILDLINKSLDDYLIFPFSKDELLLKIAMFKKSFSFDFNVINNKNDNYNKIVTLKSPLLIPLKLSKEHFTMTNIINCSCISLSNKEFQVIEALLRREGAVVTKEYLSDLVWGYNCDCIYNNIEVYISFLRKKLKSINSNVSILNKRDLGYYLALK